MRRALVAGLIVLSTVAMAGLADGERVTAGLSAGCTITVNNTGDGFADDSDLTLREAMSIAAGFSAPNPGESGQIDCPSGFPGHAVSDIVVFDPSVFPPESPATIEIGSVLPPMQGDTVDGTGAGVIVDGTAANTGQDEEPCFYIPSSFNVVRGLHIMGCVSGVEIRAALIGIPVSVPQSGVPRADENLIADNVIEGNFVGVYIEGTDAAMNMISGNIIEGGSDNGSVPDAGFAGIYVSGATGTFIGPEPEGVPFGPVGATGSNGGNIISGNGFGVYVSSGPGTVIQSNFIGTDASGLVAAPNKVGIVVTESDDVTIGGGASGEGNLVSGNEAYGVSLSTGTTGSTVMGNLIGTDATGNAALGNGSDGVVSTAQGPNLIGGDAGEQNVIAFNGRDGVRMEMEESLLGVPQGTPTDLLEIRANSIHSNDGLGINLVGGEGVDLNDNQDLDEGPNRLQNYPLLTSAETNGMTHIEGTLNSSANTGFNVRFYASDECDPSGYGEGQMYLGTRVVNTDDDGNVAFTADVGPAGFGQFITATAADGAGNTSEFSGCIAVQSGATTPTPTPGPEGILGDTDCDLDVDAVDALYVLQDVAGLEPDADCIALGDVQCDGDRDAVDALGILGYVAGLPPLLQEPGCPAIGEPVVSPATPTPTPTPTPTSTPTPTPIPCTLGVNCCVGVDACTGFTGNVGIGSCIGLKACYQASGDVGEGSCTDEEACMSNTGTIGDGSCLSNQSCLENEGNVGDDSCKDSWSCRESTGDVGNGSCTEPLACHPNNGSVGNGSCKAFEACRFNTGAIGDASCNATRACWGNSASIGDGLCNAFEVCKDNAMDMP